MLLKPVSNTGNTLILSAQVIFDTCSSNTAFMPQIVFPFSCGWCGLGLPWVSGGFDQRSADPAEGNRRLLAPPCQTTPSHIALPCPSGERERASSTLIAWHRNVSTASKSDHGDQALSHFEPEGPTLKAAFNVTVPDTDQAAHTSSARFQSSA